MRTLAIDAVEKADSGHAGAPMGQAPVGYALWTRFLQYDPRQPHWPNRDRFVLSAGHGSMLLYALLHPAGVVHLDAAGRPEVNRGPDGATALVEEVRRRGSGVFARLAAQRRRLGRATAVPRLARLYPGAPHRLMVTHRDHLHADLLAFLTSSDQTGDLRH